MKKSRKISKIITPFLPNKILFKKILFFERWIYFLNFYTNSYLLKKMCKK